MIFDNVVSKYKDRRLNENVLAVGYDALADPAAKSNSRSPFDGNVVCDFEKMVNITLNHTRTLCQQVTKSTLLLGNYLRLYIYCTWHQHIKYLSSYCTN